jgi:hypothetical protein
LSAIQIKDYNERIPMKINTFILDKDQATLTQQSFTDSKGEFSLALSLQNHHSKVMLQSITQSNTLQRTSEISQLKDIHSMTLAKILVKEDLK